MRTQPLLLAACSLVVLTGGGAALWYIKSHGFSAREKPLALEAFLARRLRLLAIPSGAEARRNPVPPTRQGVAEARDHFADHCAVCHGNRGSGKTLIGEGLYPPVPDLRDSETQGLSDGALFYIIKNGIRFTGMPGFGGEDEENWRLVSFIRHLPELTEEERSLMEEVNGMPEEERSHGHP